MSDFSVDLERKLSRLGRDIQEFVERIVPVQDAGGDFSPGCDIIESDSEYKIEVDLPGMKKEEIQISLKENVLQISGERELNLNKDEKLKRRERSTGAFSRSFAIPDHVDLSDTSASFRNGVLRITMPKSEDAGDSTSIPIS